MTRKTKYIVGSNMAGYLPISDPAEYDTLEDAKRGLREEYLFQAEGMDDNTIVTPLRDITRRELVCWQEITYAIVDSGRSTVHVWIALDADPAPYAPGDNLG